jgi:hypothetical protein
LEKWQRNNTWFRQTVFNVYAEAIAVLDNNVYIAGDEHTREGQIVKYWKNGKAIYPGNGKHPSAAYAIAVVKF